MRESFGNPDHLLFRRREGKPPPLPEGIRSSPKVHDHIKNFTLQHSDQLPLCLLHLIVKPAEYASFRLRLVVLHKSLANSRFRESIGITGLQKISARI